MVNKMETNKNVLDNIEYAGAIDATIISSDDGREDTEIILAAERILTEYRAAFDELAR